MFKVSIDNSDDNLYINDEKSLLEHLKFNNHYIKSSCGGHGSCSDCVIKVTSGAENVNEPTSVEKKLLGNVFHITKERLSCQVIVSGDVSIDISEHDKKRDEQGLLSKTAKKNLKTRVRSPSDQNKIMAERREISDAKNLAKENNDWEKHWEKEGIKVEKKLGGGKRPTKIKDLDLEKNRK